mgnify:CR=1 FL=1
MDIRPLKKLQLNNLIFKGTGCNVYLLNTCFARFNAGYNDNKRLEFGDLVLMNFKKTIFI